MSGNSVNVLIIILSYICLFVCNIFNMRTNFIKKRLMQRCFPMNFARFSN